jgi:cardiolipin synthase
MNIPNTITLIRILLVPSLIMLLLNQSFAGGLWVFIAAGASDAVDGFIAKRFNMCTRLGSILDPLADKLLVISSVVVLAKLGHIPFWLAATIIGRDVVIVTGAVAYHFRFGRIEMAPSLTSKLNTFVQLCLIFLVLCQLAGFIIIDRWFPALFALTLLTTIVSGLHYVLVWGKKAGTIQA